MVLHQAVTMDFGRATRVFTRSGREPHGRTHILAMPWPRSKLVTRMDGFVPLRTEANLWSRPRPNQDLWPSRIEEPMDNVPS